MDISRQAFHLKKALNESRYTVAITGAGISFSAGGMNFDHENVTEIQGSLQINCCTKCGKHFDSYASINIRAGADEVFGSLSDTPGGM